MAAVAAANPAMGAGASSFFHQGAGAGISLAMRTTSSANDARGAVGAAWSSRFQTASDSQESSGGGVEWFMAGMIYIRKNPAPHGKLRPSS